MVRESVPLHWLPDSMIGVFYTSWQWPTTVLQTASAAGCWPSNHRQCPRRGLPGPGRHHHQTFQPAWTSRRSRLVDSWRFLKWLHQKFLTRSAQIHLQ
uniref:Uncharacterized protein n=1 Tax=Salix viminalis TaxID=40686 RepID=A0A6N2KBK9_SALVM